VLTFFVLGGPGSGKGTLCKDLVRDHSFVHLSAGDLLREERDSGSPQGDLINQLILEGKIVPVQITVNLIKKAMEQQGWSNSKFLIDGFPRNLDNYQGWE
jgi:UMP-CMP kinase